MQMNARAYQQITVGDARMRRGRVGAAFDAVAQPHEATAATVRVFDRLAGRTVIIGTLVTSTAVRSQRLRGAFSHDLVMCLLECVGREAPCDCLAVARRGRSPLVPTSSGVLRVLNAALLICSGKLLGCAHASLSARVHK